MVEPVRLSAAYFAARDDLLSERNAQGHWVGRLASSPLSTATAISALVLAEQHGRRVDGAASIEEVYQGDLSELIVGGLHWLARHQNADGGWGDTDKSLSNIATTMLVTAAFHLTGVPAKYAGMLERAETYVRQQGGTAGLRRRYGNDKTFAVPILTNAALAGLIPWHEVPPLPFELACVPQSWYRKLRLPVVSYAIPALVAIGLARYHHAKPLNPFSRLIRKLAMEPSLRVLKRMLPESGGFLEAVPLTSFVVMSLASMGKTKHVVTRHGVEFLLGSVRADGSWPIDSDLSVWNTTQAVASLHQGEKPESTDPRDGEESSADRACLHWLVGCQQTQPHPMTDSGPGGWAWTNLSGGVPDVDDTSGALLALARLRDVDGDGSRRSALASATAALRWLLDIQNADGGWPTFCYGWGKLAFDRSGCDLTAHALRALTEWRRLAISPPPSWLRSDADLANDLVSLDDRMARAIERGWDYLVAQQGEDGSWLPLWFGNQHHAQQHNPVIGTARVLMALRDLGKLDRPEAQAGLRWLTEAQLPAGGWGGGTGATEHGFPGQECSVEETALALDALLGASDDPSLEVSIDKGLDWLVEAVESGRHRESAPIGFYFAHLWYYEYLYPLIFTVSALGSALERRYPQLRRSVRPIPTTA